MLGTVPPRGRPDTKPSPSSPDQGLRFGPKRRHIQLDGMIQINKVVFAHLEADTMRGTVEGVIDLFPIEQRPHHADIFTKRF